MLNDIVKVTHNPANIRYSQVNAWMGQVGEYKSMCKFVDRIYGIRALVILIRSYILYRGCVTIEDILRVFAPLKDNNTYHYIKFVHDNLHSHFCDDGYIELGQPCFFHLLEAICLFETGFILSLNEFNYVMERFDLHKDVAPDGVTPLVF